MGFVVPCCERFFVNIYDSLLIHKQLKIMKNEEKKVYSAPEIEVVEVQVEQGFAQSGGPQYNNPFGDEVPW